MSNAIVVVEGELNKLTPQFKEVLPEGLSVERFKRTVMNAIAINPDLLNGDIQSLLVSCQRAAMDGLMCDGKEAALVIYNSNIAKKGEPARWVKKVQYMPMVEGLKRKVFESGQIKSVSIQVVREKDHYNYELGDNEHITHKPVRNGGAIIAAYSIVHLTSGLVTREWMWDDEIEAIRLRSKSPDSGPWKTDYSEMCRKTVFRRHYKSLPKSKAADSIIEHDNDTFTVDEELVDVTPPAPEPVQTKTEAIKQRLKRTSSASLEVSKQNEEDAVGQPASQNGQQEEPSPVTISNPPAEPELPQVGVYMLPDGSGQADWVDWSARFGKEIEGSPNVTWLQKLVKKHETPLKNLKKSNPALHDDIQDQIIKRTNEG